MPAAAMTAIVIAASLLTSPARASRCPGNPGALGTSRVLTVDAREYSRVGKMQYSQSTQLPLKDREVVLTFDDGPLPPYTESVLKALAAECVKATFFSVGRQARQFPALLRRAFNEGHTIATHSQNHPLTFDQMSPERAQREIDDGIASVTAALGDPRAVAPFFRIPGLLRVTAVEDYLAGKGIAVWSVDADADDWYKTATPETVVQKAMSRLNQRGRGILLLHDVQPATALALPALLRELKANGYRVVHVVPTGRRPHLRGSHLAADTPRASSGRKKAKPRRATVSYQRTYYYYDTPRRPDPWPYIRR